MGIRYVSHAGRQLEGDSPRGRIRGGARQNSRSDQGSNKGSNQGSDQGSDQGGAAKAAVRQGKGAAARGGEEPDLHALKSWAVSDLDAFIAQVSVALVRNCRLVSRCGPRK